MRERAAAVSLVAAIFAIVAGVTTATYSFRGITDTQLNSLQTRALVLHGDIDLARYGIDPADYQTSQEKLVVEQGERIYSVYGIGASLVAAPIYAITARTGMSDRTAQTIVGVIFAAAAAAAFGLALVRLTTPAIAALCAIVFAFGTTLWPVASMAFFQQGPVLFFVCLGLLGLFSSGRRAPALAGLGFAAGTMIRPTIAIMLGIIGLYYLARDRRRLVMYCLGAALPLAILVVQNRWIWGSWIEGGYSQAGLSFDGPFGQGLSGLTIGWWRGLFVYTPFAALGVVGWLMTLKRDGDADRALAFLGIGVLMGLLVYAKWPDWGGGINQFGYRLPLELVPALFLLAAYALTCLPRLFPVGFVLGVVSVVTMTWGAAPRRDGFDDVLFAHRIQQTSLWRSWRNFFDHPGPGLLRLTLVAPAAAVMAWLVFRLRSDRSTILVAQSGTNPAPDAA
ncbi:MAG: hypothetical protein WAT66_10045 [Actinomycetota bacterium]